MSTLENNYPGSAHFFGYVGIAIAMVFSNFGSAVGISKAGIGISSMGVLKPEKIVRGIIPVVMAGILGIYGLVVAVLLIQTIPAVANDYSFFRGFSHLASGLCCGICAAVIFKIYIIHLL
jgi:V-type H+-transporting ATPase 16kDa proteolipid subunit